MNFCTLSIELRKIGGGTLCLHLMYSAHQSMKTKSQQMIIRVFALSFVMICFGCTSEQLTKRNAFEELSTLVDQYATDVTQKGNINALAIAIYRDGLTYQQYYGEIDSGAGNTPNDSTLFEIASISKVFVGSLVAKAVTENKISLEDDVREYLEGTYNQLQFDDKPVTIKELVTHTLGFRTPDRLADVYDKIFAGYYKDTAIDYDMTDLLAELKSVQLDTVPGVRYEYSNVGPEIAAYILEQVYGQPYETILQNFLRELDIDNIHVKLSTGQEKYLANGYDENGEVATVVKNPLLGGAGGLVASLPDLSKFMQLQLESEEAFIEESTRYLLKDGEDDTGYYWDLGVAAREGFYYAKTGSAKGTESVILICPDSNYGMVMIMNNQSEAAIDDWVNLYNRIENDLIEYPRINLWSIIENDFFDNHQAALDTYENLKKDSTNYFISAGYLNRVAYSYIHNDKLQEAIKIFQFAIMEYPANANLYDSLGEVYFYTEEYELSRANYEKSLQLDPKNTNAKNYLSELDKLLNQ